MKPARLKANRLHLSERIWRMKVTQILGPEALAAELKRIEDRKSLPWAKPALRAVG